MKPVPQNSAVPGPDVTFASVSDRGLSEKRPQNEDSYLELGDKGVFAVADGVGGAQAGDVASQMAVEIIGEAFVNAGPDADPEETMRIAIERANAAIYQMASDLPQLASMATTLVALHLTRDIATIAHVGDSRLYRLDPNGKLHRETNDHSVVEEEVRAGRMTAEQAQNHPSRNVISRALGAEPNVDIEVKLMIVDGGTSFLLCSDGVTRHIDDWELEALLLGNEPSAVCESIRRICYERGAEDNLTAVIIGVPRSTEPNALVQDAVSASPVAEVPDEELTIPALRHESAEDEVEDTQPSIRNDVAAVTAKPDLEDFHELKEETPEPRPEPYTSSSVVLPAAVATERQVPFESKSLEPERAVFVRTSTSDTYAHSRHGSGSRDISFWTASACAGGRSRTCHY